MKREAKEIRLVFQVLLYVGLAMLTAAPVLAQVPVDENGNAIAPLQEGATLDSIEDNALPLLSAADLEDLVGPVALYPDDLLAIVLPASTQSGRLQWFSVRLLWLTVYTDIETTRSDT